jgi:hypothetical protein
VPAAVLAGSAAPAVACSGCVPLVHATALGPGFAATVALLMAPLVLIGALALWVHHGPRQP